MFIVLGINHKSASLELREKVAFPPESMFEALQSALDVRGVVSLAILSTCNRTELYAEVAEDHEAILTWLAAWHDLSEKELQEIYYLHSSEEAAGHLMRVACGLDSLVLGEPQILGQLKSAYAVAEQADSLSSLLNRTFQQVFAVAKRVRSETAIGRNPVSVAYSAVSLAKQIFTTLENKTALLVGAGETISLVARHLREQGLHSMIIANRTLDRARELAKEFDADSVLLSDIPSQLSRADVVITSTASQLPLLGKGAVESALKERRHRMMFMVDLAVPRDIEQEVAELADVYLYTVDDLGEVIAENQKAREQAAREAETIIQDSVEQWLSSLRNHDGAAWVREYRQLSHQVREAEMQKALLQLEQGAEPREILERFSNDLTNKLIHNPTAGLNQAISNGDEAVVEWSIKLLGITNSTDISLDGEDKQK